MGLLFLARRDPRDVAPRRGGQGAVREGVEQGGERGRRPSQVAREECPAGSWRDKDPWSKVASRVHDAAMNAMTLSVLTSRDAVFRGLEVGK